MKRLSLASLLIVSLLFSGCSFFAQKEEVPQATKDEVTLEKKIGLITTSEVQNLATSPTPFLLLAEGNELIPVESTAVNFKRYTKRRVEVEGQWNDGKTVFLVDSLVSLGQETQVKQNHKSGKLGLAFNFPSLWVLREEANLAGTQNITITPYEVASEEEALVDRFTIEKTENNKKLSVREWLGLDEQYRSAKTEDTGTVFQESVIGVAQLPAVKKTVKGGETVSFYVGRDTFMYVFTHTTVGDADRDMYRNAFFDLVQSFEFIPFSDVTVTLPPKAASTPTPATQTPPAAAVKEKTLAEKAAEARDEEAHKKAVEAQAKMKEAEQKLQNEKEDIYVDYIKEHIATLAPEAAAVGGTWSVTSIEFVAPEDKPRDFYAVYVTYEDGHDMRKVLFSVTDPIAPSTMKREAYFIPGSTTDWQLKEGEDKGKAGQKTLYKMSNGSAQQITVKKGMTLLDAKSLKVKIQYPSNWYWAFRSTGYSFSNKPVTGENVLVHLTKNPEVLPENMTSIAQLGGHDAEEGEMAEAYSVCVRLTDRFCLSGNPEYKDTMKAMLETLVEM